MSEHCTKQLFVDDISGCVALISPIGDSLDQASIKIGGVECASALRKDISNGAWEIQEVRAANNADVSADTMAFVRLWFSHALSSSPTDN